MPLPSAAAAAGVASTVIFVGSTVPMLGKAVRTRDVRSYSLGNLALANAGNAVHSVYVLSLPPGPVWALHAFNLSSTLFMLVWFLRFSGRGRAPSHFSGIADSPHPRDVVPRYDGPMLLAPPPLPSESESRR